MSPESGWKLPVLGGAVLGTSYYFPLLIPNLVAFVPLLLWIDANPDAGRYRVLRAGFFFGFVAHLITLSFLRSLLVWTWLPVLLYLAFAAALGLRIALSAWIATLLRRRLALSWAVILPVSWIPLEWLQTFGDLRMTGEHVGLSLTRYPFAIQFADLVGHYGVGVVLLAVNGLVYEALLGARRRRAAHGAALAVLLVAVVAYDAWAWFRPDPPGRTLRVALVQPDIPLQVKRAPETDSEQLRTLYRLSQDAAAEGAELIVWPESARPAPIYHWLDRPDTYAMNDVQLLASNLHVPFLVGAELVRIHTPEDFTYYNAVMAVDDRGVVDETWTAKRYLVPFVESLPFRELFGRFVDGRGGQWEWITGGFSEGPPDVVFDLAGARIGAVVCFEQLFPDLARGLRNHGAELLVVVTNDAWFGRTGFQGYQADIVRLRAIENRSSVVRVANTGISGFVDRRGRYHGTTPLFEEAVAVHDVLLTGERTVYDRIGDAAAWICALSLAFLLVASMAVHRRGASVPHLR